MKTLSAVVVALLLGAFAEAKLTSAKAGAVLVKVQIAEPGGGSWRACARVWNLKEAQISVHMEAGAQRSPTTASRDLLFHQCASFKRVPRNTEIRLLADVDVGQPFSVDLEVVEVQAEGT